MTPEGNSSAPSICRIVVYRTLSGADIPGLITGVVDADYGTVYLEQFPPPGVAKDTLSFEFGVPYSEEPKPGHWRRPERV